MATNYWQNEIAKQLDIIESLQGERHELLARAERLEAETSRARTVLEGLERIADKEKTTHAYD